MKRLIYLSLLFITACGGTLSDEQRKKLREGMKLNEIRKVTEGELTDAAFALGRLMASTIEKSSLANKKLVDSLQRTYRAKILALQPGDSMLLDIEKQIVEAYTTGTGQVQLNDNVQRLGVDSVLYTKPVMKEGSDGSLQFNYALGIRMSRGQVVLSIKD